MHTSDSVRNVSKNIVSAYAHHIKDRVRDKDEDYINLGVDDNFSAYEALFKAVISKVLGVKETCRNDFSNIVITECLDVVNNTIKMKGYSRLLNNDLLAQCTYEVCVFILNKVKEEEFGYLTH